MITDAIPPVATSLYLGGALLTARVWFRRPGGLWWNVITGSWWNRSGRAALVLGVTWPLWVPALYGWRALRWMVRGAADVCVKGIVR